MRKIDTKACRTSFCERFKALRKETGLSQEAMAKYLGISRVSLTYYEKADQENGRLPDAENLIAICDKLNCSADYLLGFTNERSGSASMFEKIDVLTALNSIGISNSHILFRWEKEKIALLNKLIGCGLEKLLEDIANYTASTELLPNAGYKYLAHQHLESIMEKLERTKTNDKTMEGLW